MKLFSLSILFIFLNVLYSFSQDVITTKTGEDINAKIEEIGPDEIRYKKFDNLDGPVYVILKSDVLMIRYENGLKDLFTEEKKNESVPGKNDNFGDMYVKGLTDARRYYKGYNGAGTLTLLTTLLYPPAGLVPAIICSSTRPNKNNLNYPNAELMKKPDYYNGYTQRAKKIKQSKVWLNFGIAVGINIVVILIVDSQ